MMEAAGENCRKDGLRVDTGLDNGDGGATARDGILDDSEIDATIYACEPPLEPADAAVAYFRSPNYRDVAVEFSNLVDDPEIVVSDDDYPYYTDVHTDGRHTVFSDYDSRWRLWLYDIDGSEPIDLLSGTSITSTSDAWVLDGYVVFRGWVNSVANIWRYDIDNDTMLRLTSYTGSSLSPSRPAIYGDRVFFFFAEVSGSWTYSIRSVPLDGGSVTDWTSGRLSGSVSDFALANGALLVTHGSSSSRTFSVIDLETTSVDDVTSDVAGSGYAYNLVGSGTVVAMRRGSSLVLYDVATGDSDVVVASSDTVYVSEVISTAAGFAYITYNSGSNRGYELSHYDLAASETTVIASERGNSSGYMSFDRSSSI